MTYITEKRNRIIQESVVVFNTTDDLTELENMYSVIIEQIRWATRKIEEGYPIRFDEGCSSQSDINREFNKKVVGIVEHQLNGYKSADEMSKTDDEKGQYQMKIQSLVSKALHSLKSHENRTECRTAIVKMMLEC